MGLNLSLSDTSKDVAHSPNYNLTLQLNRDTTIASHCVASKTIPAYSVAKDFIVPLYWPLLVFVVLIIFRQSVAQTLQNLKRVNIAGTIVDFYRDGDTADPSNVSKPEQINTEIPEPSPNRMEWKILATMIHYQRVHHGENQNARWTFTLGALHPEFNEFTKAIRQLFAAGYVGQVPETGQFCLTDVGLRWCIDNESKLKNSIRFSF